MKAGDLTSTTVLYKGFIYEIHCWATGISYIGSTKNTHRRFLKHNTMLRLNKHFNNYLQDAWNLYGEECFEFTILAKFENITILELRSQEAKLINSLETCYNITSARA